MQYLRIGTILGIMLIALTACRQPTAGTGDSRDLLKYVWQLEKIEYVDRQSQSVPGDQEFTLEVTENYTFGGRSDCNAYGGNVVLEDNAFRVSELVHTEAYCGDASLDGFFVNALDAALSYKIRNDRLYIYFDDGFKSLVFSIKEAR